MDLSKYANALDALREELLSSLSADEKRELISEYSDPKLATRILRGHLGNMDEVHRYILATPIQRTRRKRWRDRKTRLMLTLVALYRVQFAKAVLSALAESSIQFDQPYRRMVLSASSLFDSIMMQHPFSFPLKS